MIKTLFLFCAFMTMNVCVFAQNDKAFKYVDSSLLFNTEVADTLQINTATPEDDPSYLFDTNVTIRPVVLDVDSVKKWRNQKEYRYVRYLDSLLRKNQQQLAKPPAISKPGFLDKILSSGILQLFLWTVAIGVIGYILYQLFLSKGFFLKRKHMPVVSEKLTEDEKFLSTDFDGLVRESCKQGNYRAAIRYLFLKTLQELSDKQLISFTIDKTNSKYVAELSPQKQPAFATLVLTYEYAWYGNLNIDKSHFTEIETRFTEFLKTI